MAHPMVESLKRVSLRHGEKAAVALASLVCVLLILKAGTRESLSITPDQINTATKSAQSTLQKPQSKEDIVALLDNAGLVPQDFASKARLATLPTEEKYAFVGPPFVYSEPGAGLIRDDIKSFLIAPSELYVNANRGSIQLLARKDDGSIEYEPIKKGETKKPKSLPRSVLRRRGLLGGGMGAGGSAMAGSGMGMPGMGMPGAPKTTTEEEKKKRAAEARAKAALFVGAPKDEEEEEIEKQAAAGQKPKELTRGVRLVAITGVLDHKQLKENYVKALKDSNAQPHYLRLDMERQERAGEDWSDWVVVDHEANQKIQNDMVEMEEELAPDDVRLEGLVDMLPFFKVGYYKGVHVAEFVPKDKRVTPEPSENMMSAEGMMMGGRGDMMMMGSSMTPDASSYGMSGMGGRGDMMMMGSGSEGMMMGYGMGMGMGMSGQGVEDTNFAKSTKDRIMTRVLDFTVEPDTLYRYRVRIVVRNPNLGWTTVSPGTDTQSEELAGPWSEPTPPVRVPADVAIFAARKLPGGRRSDSIHFDVVKWNEKDGLTIHKELDYAPGQIIGAPDSAAVPKDDGKGRITKQIDFTSRQVILDTSGGNRPLNAYGMGAQFDTPARALVLRPDGVLVIRDEARDFGDEQLKQMRDIYKQILEDADKGGKKHNEQMGMGSDMMPAP